MTERYDKNLKHGKYLDTRRHFCIHPDMQDAYTEYDGTGNSFEKVFDERKVKIAAGVKYWNDDYDEQMAKEIRERNKRPGLRWPRKRGDVTEQEQLENFRSKLRKIWKE